MMELNLTGTRIGAMTISAAAADDACGWILLATISGIVEARFQILRSLEMIAGTVGFFLLMLLVARPLLKAFVRLALLAGIRPREALAVGAMMNARGLMELVVINVGRNLGVIPDSVFCTLVLMALSTTVMTTPLLLRIVRGTELEAPVRKSEFLAR
jgi:Kef-type K+ transport system membrane component KefB